MKAYKESGLIKFCSHCDNMIPMEAVVCPRCKAQNDLTNDEKARLRAVYARRRTTATKRVPAESFNVKKGKPVRNTRKTATCRSVAKAPPGACGSRQGECLDRRPIKNARFQSFSRWNGYRRFWETDYFIRQRKEWKKEQKEELRNALLWRFAILPVVIILTFLGFALLMNPMTGKTVAGNTPSRKTEGDFVADTLPEQTQPDSLAEDSRENINGRVAIILEEFEVLRREEGKESAAAHAKKLLDECPGDEAVYDACTYWLNFRV